MTNQKIEKRALQTGSNFRNAVLALLVTNGALALALGLAWMARSCGWMEFDHELLGMAAAIFGATMSLASFADRFPRGHERAAVRLMSAAFCRTILPLLAFSMWAWYSNRSFSTSDGLVLAISYFIPFATGVFLAVCEQADAGRAGVGPIK